MKIFSNIRRDENSPNVHDAGLLKCRLFTYSALFEKNESGEFVISKPTIERYCKAWEDEKNIVVLDIEHWPMTGKFEVLEETSKKCIEVIEEVRKHLYWKAIGIYSMMPVNNWFAPLGWELYRNKKNHSWYETAKKNYRWWLRQSRFWLKSRKGQGWGHKGLTDHVNFVSPDIYAVTKDIEDWKMVTNQMIIESRKHQKPIYPYISPYVQGREDQLPDDHLVQQIEFLKDHDVDGCIIYTYPVLKQTDGWWVKLSEYLENNK